MSLGLEHGKNRLAPYSTEWPTNFAIESEKIEKACAECVLAIEHVGSTAVPGLASKPIIDIAVGVTTLEVAERMIMGMQTLGYDYPGDIGIPGERIFGRGPEQRQYLVHIVVLGSPQWHRYLAFRDALISDKSLADEYAQLKFELVSRHPDGRAVYTSLKSEFIHRVLERLA